MKRQAGFSLVELIIVVVVLGLLAATALPRFIDITDQAEDAAAEGVAGGFASAVGITRAQWEVEGRPTDGNVILDGQQVSINDFGYPSGTNDRAPTNMNDAACIAVFNQILQSPAPVADADGDVSNVRYAVDMLDAAGDQMFNVDGTAGITPDLCIYTQTATLNLNANGTIADTLPLATDVGKGFTYNPGTGQVASFSTN